LDAVQGSEEKLFEF